MLFGRRGCSLVWVLALSAAHGACSSQDSTKGGGAGSGGKGAAGAAGSPTAGSGGVTPGSGGVGGTASVGGGGGAENPLGVALTGVTAVAVGDDLACAVAANGVVACWGNNTFGELGNTAYGQNSLVPLEVAGIPGGANAIAAGKYFACAVTLGGGAMCWGFNPEGRLGNNSTSASNGTPVQVVGLTSGVTALSIGRDSACAITAQGGVMCWGSNSNGKLGNNTTIDSSVPVQVAGLTAGATSISVADDGACAVVAGAVLCWGSYAGGTLAGSSLTPVPISSLSSGATAVSLGNFGSGCAITTAGALMCWGDNGYGELGDGNRVSSVTAVQVTGLSSGVTAVAAVAFSRCAVMNGTVSCWGSEPWATVDGSILTQVGGLTSAATAISAGHGGAADEVRVCVATAVGGVSCWGNWTFGGLTREDSSVAVAVP